MSKKIQDYDAFEEKFKPKKTTDDCYTPPLVYDAVLAWARKHLDVGDRPVVRPFYPGVLFQVSKSGGAVVSKATTRDEFGKSILLSDRMTVEKKAAEKMAAEKMAAEKKAAENLKLTEATRLLVEELNAPTTAEPRP